MPRTTSPPLLPRSAWCCCDTCGRPREYWRIVADDAGGMFCSHTCVVVSATDRSLSRESVRLVSKASRSRFGRNRNAKRRSSME